MNYGNVSVQKAFRNMYMNVAAARAAFVMTVSAASMYCLLGHPQHARDMNIHKLHPLPEKNRLGLCRFSA